MKFQQRRITFTLALAMALLGYRGAQTNAAAQTCAELEHKLDAQLSALNLAAEQLGAFRAIGDSALEAVKTCPDSARLWYLAVRSAEVLQAPFGGEAFASYGGPEHIAADAAKHAPQSVQVATVLARLDGSVVSARKAYDLDRSYGPARNALALALSRAGKPAEALELLDSRTGLADHLTRARILLQDKKAKQAVSEARAALQMPATSLEEPTPTMIVLRDGNELLAFALLDQDRTREALGPLRTAAGAGSTAAQRELAKRR